MPARLSLVQLGKGTVGAALIEQIREKRPALMKRLGVEIVYAGIAGKRSGAFEADGLDLARWKDEVESGGLDGRKIVKKALGGLPGSTRGESSRKSLRARGNWGTRNRTPGTTWAGWTWPGRRSSWRARRGSKSSRTRSGWSRSVRSTGAARPENT